MRPAPAAPGATPPGRGALARTTGRGAEALGLKNRGGGRAGNRKENRDTIPAPPADFGNHERKTMQKALLWKILLVGLVALLLQIPVEMIRGLVGERQQTRDGVLADIARGTSEAQRIAGPVLYIPWTRRSVEATENTDDAGRTRTTRREKIERGHVALLPATLALDGDIDLQPKRRGIYISQVYTLNATLRGTFTLPPGVGASEGPGTLEWGNALLVLGVQDTRGIRDRIDLEWGGTKPMLSPGGVEAVG